MAAVVNFIDATLRSAPYRTINLTTAQILLTATAPAFHVTAAGTNSPASITFNSTLLDLAGAISFTCAGGTLSNVTATSADLTFANMGGSSATVTASITVNGTTFSASYTVSTVQDGASGTGTPGARGAGHFYASGSAWADATADAACPGGKVVGDVVTISNGTNFVMEKQWNGTSWVITAIVIDGSLLVPQSVTAASINANGLSIRDTNGNVILSAGSSLAQQTRINTNLIPRLSSWPASSAVGGAGVGNNTNDNRFLNGEFIYLPNSSGYVGITTGAIGIPANSWYTVSFDAYCTSTSRTLNVDVYGGGVDSAGIAIGLTNVATRYTFTEQMPNSGSATSAVLRVFCTSAGSDVVVSNVKVEFGLKDTAWCDNVITKQNVTTFIQGAAIGLALIDTASIGQLSALSAYLGTVDIGPSGHIASGQTDYNVGNGVWIGGSNAPRMSMRTANGATFLCDPGNNVLTLSNATIASPTTTGLIISDQITLATISDVSGGIAATGATQTVFTTTLAISGGLAPYQKPQWTSNVVSSTGLNLSWSLNTAGTTLTIKAATRTSGADCSVDFTVTVLDARGMGATQKFNVYCNAT